MSRESKIVSIIATQFQLDARRCTITIERHSTLQATPKTRNYITNYAYYSHLSAAVFHLAIGDPRSGTTYRPYALVDPVIIIPGWSARIHH